MDYWCHRENVKKMTELTFTNSDIKLYHTDRNDWLDIDKASKMYDATYVGEFTLPSRDGGWVNMPVSVFWQKIAHPQGSNYFGLRMTDNGPVICDAVKATEPEYTASYDSDKKEAVYSAYRHDYQTHGKLMADGGLDYFRSNSREWIHFKIKDGLLHVVGP